VATVVVVAVAAAASAETGAGWLAPAAVPPAAVDLLVEDSGALSWMTGEEAEAAGCATLPCRVDLAGP
jgi:hypothetical protein